MRAIILFLILAGAVFGQCGKTVVNPTTGQLDCIGVAGGNQPVIPGATFASPPTAPATGSAYLFTDAISTGVCAGGGTTTYAICTWNGSSFVATAAATGTGLGDPGVNSVVYRNGAGTSIPATATQLSGPNFCSDAGSTDTYACNLSPVIAAYVTGTLYWFKANTANTGAATINFNSKGALPIKKMQGAITTALDDNDIRVGQWVGCFYDGTNCQMATQLGNQPTATQVGLGSVTNDAQTKSAVMPNTAPSAGQIPVGNAGGTAYAPITVSGNITITSAGVVSVNGLQAGAAGSKPANCTTGQVYFATDATAGQNLYYCTTPGTPGTWTQELNSGGGGGGTVTSSGTPLIHQVPVWTTSTDLKGVSVGTDNQVMLGHTGADPGFGSLPAAALPAATASAIGAVQLTVAAQKFFGTAAPGSVTGNLPGDFFTDTTNHNEYVCNAPSGTAAPACTSVTAVGWLLVNGGGGGTPGGSSGQMQYNSSSAFAGQASVFDAGTLVQRGVECSHGTLSYTALTSAASSQEITILGGSTPLSGNLRYAGIVLSETTQFATTTGLTVSMGRPGSTTHAELTNGVTFPLMVSAGDLNYVSTRPLPPQITTTYSIVLNFAVTSGFVNAATAGSLTWEVCAYAAR